jgi:hypothetical protein
MALKWSGRVEETGVLVTRNLADPGTDVMAGTLVENRYPFALPHTAVGIAIRTHLNTLSVAGAVVNLVRGSTGIVDSFSVPLAGTTMAFSLPNILFVAGDDVEVQVVIPPGLAEAKFVSLTVTVEFS